jgi:polysaccharide export outer membrane protein
MKDGDLVKVFPVLPFHTNNVMLAGNVHRPGEYQWRKGMRVSDLIKEAQGVLPHTYFKYALVKRLEGPQKYTHFVQVDLAGALSGNSLANLYLQNHDELDVYSLDQLRDTPMVSVSGPVRVPGQYLLSERMRISDLIYLAGGLKEDAYKPRAELARVEVAHGHAVHSTYDLNLSDILQAGSNDDIVLKANDQLVVSSVIGYQLPQRTVMINGEVQNPGLINFNEGMRARDLLAAAGGFKDDAYRQRVELARTVVVDGTQTRRAFTSLDLRKGSDDLNYPLAYFDELFVTVAPNWHLPWTVNVSGEVSQPGQYVIRDNERLSSLIVRCGGFRADAYPAATVFTRSSVKQLEQQELDQARQRISQELLQLSVMAPMYGGASSSDASGGGSASMTATFTSLQQLLAGSVGQQADGRVVVHINDVLKGRTEEDVTLQDGDNIVVPLRPASVNVLGMVYHPSSVVVKAGMTVSDYLYAAGGATPQGDLDRLMVIQADGTVITQDGLKNSNRNRLFPLLPVISSGLMSQTLSAGDTVYVPESLANLQSVIKMKYWTDITTIISNSASGLAIVGLLATKL